MALINIGSYNNYNKMMKSTQNKTMKWIVRCCAVTLTVLVLGFTGDTTIHAEERSIETQRKALLREYRRKKDALDETLKSRLAEIKRIPDKDLVRYEKTELYRDINSQKKQLKAALRQQSQELYVKEMALKGHSVSFEPKAKRPKKEKGLSLRERIRQQDKELGLNRRQTSTKEKAKAKKPKKRKVRDKLVTAYVTESCPYCKDLYNFLKSEKIKHRILDVNKSKKARREFDRLGGGGVPLVKIGNDHMNGFSKDWILDRLE